LEAASTRRTERENGLGLLQQLRLAAGSCPRLLQKDGLPQVLVTWKLQAPGVLNATNAGLKD